MLRKFKIAGLLCLVLVSTNHTSAKMSATKKFLIGTGSLITAGYALCKIARYWPYFETQHAFDHKTTALLHKIETKYGKQTQMLDGYNYQTCVMQAQIDQDLAQEIIGSCDLDAYLEEFKTLQNELELRLSRLTSWCSTIYLFEKWIDQLTDASLNMYNLQLWLEQAQLPLRAKMLAINYKYLVELNNLHDTQNITKMVFMRNYHGASSKYPFVAYVQALDLDVQALQALSVNFSGHTDLKNQASLAFFGNQIAALFANLEFIRKVVTLDQRYVAQKRAYEAELLQVIRG